MRYPMLATLPLLLVLLACAARVAAAQNGPPPNTGGVVITRSPEDGAAVPASLSRTLSRTDVLAARRWLVGSTAPLQFAASRPSFKARRAGLRRNPTWVP